MIKTNKTELVLILDRSGSMSYLEGDTIGGYNSMLEKQRKEEGEALVTTVLFDNNYEMLHNRVPIAEVNDITNREYYARGTTALLDAVGKTINYISRKHEDCAKEDVPSKTLFVIITDGYENASREFTHRQLKSLIEHKRENSGWEFIFLAANIDAAETARAYGISEDRAVNYCPTGTGTKVNFDAVSNVMSSVRYAKPIDENWAKEITDYMDSQKD